MIDDQWMFLNRSVDNATAELQRFTGLRGKLREPYNASRHMLSTDLGRLNRSVGQQKITMIDMRVAQE